MTRAVGSVRVRGRGLGKRFGAVTALAKVDVDLADGEALAILGPNGAGKSTLLRLLAGLARPTSGSLEIATSDGAGLVARTRGEARRAVGFAGHATQLYAELTARENLVFHGRLHGVADPRARAEALLQDEGLAQFADRQAGTFSRGMAQRLTIARALVHDPPLLLFDEPFTGLDRRAADRLRARLVALRAEGRAIALVTHDLRQASEMATSALVLVGGRAVLHATGADVAFDALEQAYADALDGLVRQVRRGTSA